MKLLRHILSHLLLILFLIAAGSVFYYRTLLLPSDVVANINGVVKEIYPPALQFVSKRDYFWSIRGERMVSFDDLTIFKNEEKIAHNSQPDEVPEAGSQSNIKVATAILPKLTGAETEKVTELAKAETKKISELVTAETEKVSELAKAGTKKTPELAKDEKTDKPLPVKEPLIVADKKTKKADELPIVIKDSDTRSERDLLISARNAFNKGETVQSENFYLELTLRDKGNPNIFGELGNVYYSQGKWNDAGQAYYEAATRLITEGNHNQVAYLQRVIKGLNTEQAEKLAQLMMQR